MTSKEDVIAGLMDRLDDPTLTRQEFDDIRTRIEDMKKLSE